MPLLVLRLIRADMTTSSGSPPSLMIYVGSGFLSV